MPNNMLNPNPFYSQLKFGQEARDKIKAGLNIVCDAAKITLGSKGRNVFLDKDWTKLITNDGVSIVTGISLEDKFEDMGAHIAKQASAATNDAAGDGTTTTVVLLQKLVEDSFKASQNPMDIRNSLTEASQEAIKLLKTYSNEVKTASQIKQVATISAESEKIGSMISDIITAIGHSGFIVVEESQDIETKYELIEGFEIPKGYINNRFATNADSMEASYQNVPVLISQKKIAAISDLVPLIDKVSQAGKKELVIFCDDIDPGAVGQLVFNKVNSFFHTLVIRCSPNEMDDVAGLTGGSIIAEDSGIQFDKVELKDLGKIKKIIATDKKTTIVGSKSPTGQIARLSGLAEQTKNEVEKERYHERIKRLQGKMAVIRVGAPIEADMKYQKLKIDDAVQAVKAAIEDGIVEGGGLTLYRISKQLPDKGIGYQLLSKALQEPLRQIIRNAGKDEAEIIGFLNQKRLKLGWNANDNTFVNMIKAGIIDPTKVQKCAIQNAVSAAGTLITTEVAVTYKVITKD